MPAPRNATNVPLYVDEQIERLDEAIRDSAPLFSLYATAPALTAATFDWGNGMIIPWRSALIAMSMFLPGATARAKIDVERDGTVETMYALDLTGSNSGFVEFPKPLEFFPGSRLRLRTVTEANTVADNVATVWLRRG